MLRDPLVVRMAGATACLYPDSSAEAACLVRVKSGGSVEVKNCARGWTEGGTVGANAMFEDITSAPLCGEYER